MFRVEDNSNHLDSNQWPSSTYQERASYSWPKRSHRYRLPQSVLTEYMINLGGAFVISSALSIGSLHLIKPIYNISADNLAQSDPIQRNVVTFGPEVDFNNIAVNQEPGVVSETLILEFTDGETVTSAGTIISAEGADSAAVTTAGPNFNVNFPSKKP